MGLWKYEPDAYAGETEGWSSNIYQGVVRIWEVSEHIVMKEKAQEVYMWCKLFKFSIRITGKVSQC